MRCPTDSIDDSATWKLKLFREPDCDPGVIDLVPSAQSQPNAFIAIHIGVESHTQAAIGTCVFDCVSMVHEDWLNADFFTTSQQNVHRLGRLFRNDCTDTLSNNGSFFGGDKFEGVTEILLVV